MSPSTRQAIETAAALLEHEAEMQRQSCEVGSRQWACLDCADKSACSSREGFAALAGAAKDLRELLVRSQADSSADAARLDFLEREATEEPLVLHSLPVGTRGMGGFRGLGLGCTGRSIRQALDAMMSAAQARRGSESP